MDQEYAKIYRMYVFAGAWMDECVGPMDMHINMYCRPIYMLDISINLYDV